jgi:hypothetical protein
MTNPKESFSKKFKRPLERPPQTKTPRKHLICKGLYVVFVPEGGQLSNRVVMDLMDIFRL